MGIGMRGARAAAVVAMLWLATAARAADYWVKNGGSDGADGLSVATAWATLPHAADQVGPGDTVHVLDGSYQGFYLETSGTPGHPTIEALLAQVKGGGLLRMMAHEIERQDAGAAAIVAELSGAVFTLAVRAHLESASDDARTLAGVLGVMADARLAPALVAMLQSPGDPWTVASLAARCHLSRAAFARLFAQHARTGPLALLTSLRMELASRLLAVGDQDTASIGEAVGYRSEAAFNRAFARHAGMTPGRYRRGQRR